MSQLLGKLFPDVNTADDNETNTEARNYAKSQDNYTIFTEAELNTIITHLNPKKAPGPDFISNKMIKWSYGHLKSSMLGLFNKCMSIGYFPRKRKQSTVRIMAKPNRPKTDRADYPGEKRLVHQI